MGKIIFVVYALCLACSTAFGSSKLTKDQLKAFDMVLAGQEKIQCDTQPPATRETWLLGEIKKMGEPEPKIQDLARQVWNSQIIDFKVDGDLTEGTWVRPSLGTFGVINGQPFQPNAQGASKDPQEISASLIDVGKGTKVELDSAKNIKNAFWLVEESPAIPDLAALALEAKSRGAVGLLVYQEKKSSGPPDTGEASTKTPWPLPVLEVSAGVVHKIKEKLKTKAVEVSLALKTEFPVAETGRAISVKEGARDRQAFVVVNEDDCLALGKALAFFSWLHTDSIPVQGTTFIFFDHRSFSSAKFVQDWGQPAARLDMAEAGESDLDAKKFLNQWFKSDQNPDDVFDIKPILKKANLVQKDLKGFIAGEDLKKYNDLLKGFEKPAKAAGGPVNYKLAQILEPVEFSGLVSDIKFLKQAHEFAEKGQWDQMVTALKHVSDFQWAENVSLETFLSYEKQRAAGGAITPNPDIWVEMQKGRGHIDELLELLEHDIDRMDHQLSDNFLKLQKSIEAFNKI